jgi:hypothetical protein
MNGVAANAGGHAPGAAKQTNAMALASPAFGVLSR